MLKHQSLVWKVWIGSLIFLFYLVVAVVVTWPLLPNISTHLNGSSTDALLHYWNGWWVLQAIRDGISPFTTNLLFHPDGVSLVHHNFAWLNILPWLALQLVIDDIAAYNLVLILALASGGFATFYLTNELTGNRIASLISGLIYLSWPYRLSQLDHPNLITTQWIVFFLLFLVYTTRYSRLRDGILAGVCFALVGYTRWQLLIPAAVMGGIIVLFDLTDRAKLNSNWKPLLAGFITAIVLLIPASLLMFGEQSSTQSTLDSLLREGEESTMQTDLLAYLIPSQSHPAFGNISEKLYDRLYESRSLSRRFPAYIGGSVVILALLGIWYARRKSMPWFLMSVIFILLASGHTWKFNGRLYSGIPTFYQMLEPLYVFRLMRVPDRYNMFLALPIAVLAGYGTLYLLKKAELFNKSVVISLAFLIGGVIAFEYFSAPINQHEARLSKFYESLSNQTSNGAILDLPINSIKSKRNMFAQTIHNRPIVFGHVSREPLGAYEYIDQNVFLSGLRQSNEMSPWLTDVSEELNSLAKDNIEFIVMHKDQITPDRIEHWKRFLPFDPVFEDESVVAYSTTPALDEDFVLLEDLLPGIGPVRVVTSSECFNPGEVLEVDVAWGTTMPIEQNYQVVFTLNDNQKDSRDEIVLLIEELQSTNWGQNNLSWVYYTTHLDSGIHEGVYQLEMSLRKNGEIIEQSTLAIGNLLVTQENCDFTLPLEATRVNAVFGDQLRLVGYQLLRLDNEHIEATLYWKADQRMLQDYKVFVHVFDKVSGIPVAQDDSMPNRGDFPTGFWVPGEELRDQVPISLIDTPADQYGVAVGVYDPLTGERLPVVDRDGFAPEDRRLILMGETIEVDN